jgi:hypothetical protein
MPRTPRQTLYPPTGETMKTGRKKKTKEKKEKKKSDPAAQTTATTPQVTPSS